MGPEMDTPAATAGEPATVVRLLALSEQPIQVDEVLAAVEDPGAGGTVLFVGTVRDEDGGKDVRALGYSAHPSVLQILEQVAGRVAAGYPVRALAAVHRVGILGIGEVAVAVAVSCPHRGEAFDAARQLIDDLKHEVPIWKHQTFGDGSQEWVGAG